MPWHPCTSSRDSITQDAGKALPSEVEGGLRIPNITSSCRDANGTWVTWIENAGGDMSSYTGNDFPVKIAFFPDDGSAAQLYELPVNYAWGWTTTPAFGAAPCSIEFPFDPGKFDTNIRQDLSSWETSVLDVQIRSDGSIVWVVIMAAESVMYPYIAGVPWPDRCGILHPSILLVAEGEGLSPGEDGNVFAHDTTGSTVGTYWTRYGTGGSTWDDDPGDNGSFRWHPARVTVYGGDIGGFTKLGTVEAKYENLSGNPDIGLGLCSGIECAASPAEPGVLHVMWAEGGSWDSYRANLGQRITYSQWGFDTKISATVLAETTEALVPGGAGYMAPGNWAWTAEMIVRNDHGSPCAIVLPWNITERDVFGVQGSPLAPEYWDLSSGDAVVVQTMDDATLITAAEAGYPDPILPRGLIINSSLTPSPPGFVRSHFASSLYSDPLLDNRDVYLIAVTFWSGALELAPGGAADSTDRPVAFYRIPCDGSDNFDFMDGTRLVTYSILPQRGIAPQGDVGAGKDFVSDPGNVWMPTLAGGFGGAVLHLPRTCERTWEVLSAFPTPEPDGSVLGVLWQNGVTGPPTIYTDGSGDDWLVAGGQVAVAPADLVDNPSICAAWAKICRCCVPCGGNGVHAWHRI